MAKQKPCCARVASKLTTDTEGLRALARKEAYAASRGRRTDGLQEQIRAQKRIIEADKRAIDDHAATHAGDPDS